LCHMNGFHHEVRLGSSPTPEPSTKKGGMDLDLLVGKACGLGCGRTVHRLELRSGPDLASVCPQIDDAVQRLHHQMGQIRHLVNRFDLLCSLGKRVIRITISAYTRAWRLSLLAKLRSEEHTSELQSPDHLVCRLPLEKNKNHILTN